MTARRSSRRSAPTASRATTTSISTDRPSWTGSPDGGFAVSDGYNGTRVVVFDKDGKFVKAWGERGENGKETRPGYFNNVHGIAIDPKTNRIFVNDRGNRRVQVFDRERQVPRPVELRPEPHRRPSVPHLHRQRAVGVRSRHQQDAEVRPERKLPLLVGHVGRLPRRLLGRSRLQQSTRTETSIRRRSTPAARRSSRRGQGREPGDAGRQAAPRGLEVSGSCRSGWRL